jgi:hypothetical protein
MAWTSTQIANRALGAAGIKKAIVDLDTDDSAIAEVIREVYDLAVGVVDSEFPWPHSKRVEEMSLVDGDEDDPYSDDWTYAYRYSSYWQKFLGVVEDGYTGRAEVVDGRHEYEITSDEDGRLVLTDVEDASAIIHVLGEEGTWPAAYVEALAIKIASMAAPRLYGEAKTEIDLTQKYVDALATAKVITANEAGYERPLDPPSIQARRGASRWHRASDSE